MKNHLKINNKIIQTNKKFSDLKKKQKEKINEWLYLEYSLIFEKNNNLSKENESILLNNVMNKILNENISISHKELYLYFISKKTRYNKRFLERDKRS